MAITKTKKNIIHKLKMTIAVKMHIFLHSINTKT